MLPHNIFQSIFHVPWHRSLVSDPRPLDVPASAAVSQKDMPDCRSTMRPLEHLSQDVVRSFSAPCEVRNMLQMSSRLRDRFHEQLQSSPACMLPSFCHTLPSGQEQGTFVALDLGGSTFRAALVHLSTRDSTREPVEIQRMSVTRIDEDVRRLSCLNFFDWMARKIQIMLQEGPDLLSSADKPVPIGLAWSFPIAQTSNRGGKIQGMGKGFACQHGAIGKDIGDLLESACHRAGFNIRVESIINDSSAVLLSQAYAYPSTSMGLINGTGMNASVFLPVSCMGRSKFGPRDEAWFDRADRVITNTELSMFGKNILPETRWDETLNREHQMPDFQPLEYMTTGRYLGEILRLIIIEAVDSCGMFGGSLPHRLREQYSLDTILLSTIEGDQSQGFTNSAARLQVAFGLSSPPSIYEMAFLRVATEAISHRAAAYLAVAVHALWSLQKETDVNLTTPAGTPKTTIACNGSVIQKYPGLKDRCEKYLEQMVFLGSGGGVFQVEKIALQPAEEAAVIGAAVAVAMANGT